MGETKKTQRRVKAAVDEKLAMAAPDRELLEMLAVECAKEPSQVNTFQYAFALCQSTTPAEQRYALSILDGLVQEGYEHQTDCFYGAATALYLLKNYDEARTRCEAILRNSPENRNAAELHLACIEAAEEVAAKEKKRLAFLAIGSTTSLAAAGLVLGVATILMKGRR